MDAQHLKMEHRGHDKAAEVASAGDKAASDTGSAEYDMTADKAKERQEIHISFFGDKILDHALHLYNFIFLIYH